METAVASKVARRIGDVATHEVSLLCGVPDEVEFLRQDLRSIQTFLSVAAEAHRGNDGDAVAADSVRRVRDVAYEAENVIDAANYRVIRNRRRTGLLGAMMRYARKPRDLVELHKLGKDIVRVRSKIQYVKSSREFLDAINPGGRVATQPQEPLHPITACYDKESIVGLEGDVECVEKWLKDKEKLQLTVISIVAMGGAGKTTLARKVYNSAVVKEHFEALAFVSISQQFEVLHVLKEIATQAMEIKKKVDTKFDKISQQADIFQKMGEQELAEILHNFLETKVLDCPRRCLETGHMGENSTCFS